MVVDRRDKVTKYESPNVRFNSAFKFQDTAVKELCKH